MDWRVYVDFDGTITRDDVTNSVLDRFASPVWRAIEEEWQTGAIGSCECMDRQVRLVRATAQELDDFVACQPVDPHFVAFIDDCARLDIPVMVVSDGLDRVVNATLRRLKLQHLPVRANHLVQVDDKRWQLLFPYARDVCRSHSGNCKCSAHESAAAGRATRTILIGDGRSDFCAAKIADVVFAKKELLRLCRESAIGCIPFNDFGTLRGPFADVVAHTRAGVTSTRAIETIDA